ncbi:unnamed protein product [Linum trigynum]
MQVEGGANRVQQNKQQTAANHQFPVPLVSRLDHLDSLMKYLEGKQNSQKGGGGEAAKQQTAAMLEVAMREAYFKGSLMDRVASLEHRLFQLCLEMESTNTSASSSQTSGGGSTSTSSTTTAAGSRSQTPSSSFPTTFSLSNPRHPLLHHHQARSHLQQVEEEREEEGETKGKDSKKGSSSKNNSKTRKEEKNCRSNGNTSSNKKQIKWPQIRPLKLLGC